MIRRLWDAYRVEVTKAVRQRVALLGPVLVVAVVLVMPRMHPIAQDGHGDYGFIGYATTSVVNVLGLFLLLVFCAPQIAGEVQSGAVRTLLVRPLFRVDFYLAKLAVSMTYALVLLAAASLCAWGVAWRLGDLTGVTVGGELLYTHGEMLSAYGVAAATALAPLAATVAFALLVSTLARSAAAATAAAIAVWLAVDLVKYPLGVSAGVFSTYLETPWQVFLDRAQGVPATWWQTNVVGLGVSLASFAVFTLAGAAVFRRRNLRL
jgi:ABC-2 type transport system permease protein